MWQSLVDEFSKFVKAPFGGQMDLFSLFLVIGAIMIFIVFWSRIVAHLGE